MGTIVKKQIREVTEQEMGQYQQRLNDVVRMISFHSGQDAKECFSEKEWLIDILEHLDKECKSLIRAYGINSDRMSFREVEVWKEKYNSASRARSLHLAIYFLRFGEEYKFV